MAELNNHYQKIMKELKDNLNTEEDKDFALSKFQELSMMFMDIIDKLTNISEERIKEIKEEQTEMQDRFQNLQKRLDEIESDIYEDDDEFEFEIVCPYCNHEFVTEISDDSNVDIECPECHNVIELNWNEENCAHNCNTCKTNCEEKAKNKEDDDM